MEDEEFENVDSTNDEVDTSDTLKEEESLDLDDIEDIERAKELLLEKEKQNKQLFQRAKKAEEKLKESKVKTEDIKEIPQSKSIESKDEQFSVSKAVQAELDKRDIDALEVSDELKKEIKSYAKLNDVSIKSAFKSDYIQFRKKQEDDNGGSSKKAVAAAGNVTKSNTLIHSLACWDRVVEEVSRSYPDVEYGRMYVDEASANFVLIG